MVQSLNVNVDRQAQDVTADHQGDEAANSNKARAQADADDVDSTRQDHFDGFADNASSSKPATAVSSQPGKVCKQQNASNKAVFGAHGQQLAATTAGKLNLGKQMPSARKSTATPAATRAAGAASKPNCSFQESWRSKNPYLQHDAANNRLLCDACPG